jgi:hypothetical protein
MNSLFLTAAKVAPILFAACLFSATSASAQSVTADKEAVNQTLEQINNYQQLEQNNQSQVTNVNQLRDVSPTDWAYEALRSLVDRYGCISGFPNQTYRGNQPLTRYEFAAGLNSCLNQIERLIASNSGGVDAEELETINRLQQEFEAELATLGGRVDEIESRTAVLEDSQFSTTTKLKGEAIFSVSDVFGDEADNDNNDNNNQDVDSQVTLSDRVRLNFDTSFTGKDRLRTRLQAGNFTQYNNDVTGTNSTRLGYDAGGENSIGIEDLHYRFPVGEKADVWVGAVGLDLDDVFNTGNPELADSGTGALSRFGRYNPLLFRGPEGAGAGVNLDIIEDKVGFNALYLANDSNASVPEDGQGLFNGSYSAGGQLEFSPFEALELTATYVRDYQTEGALVDGEVEGSPDYSGGTVSGDAVAPFGADATSANKFGLGASFNVGEKIVLAATGGYATIDSLETDDSGNIWTWGANASLLDLVKEGSVLSIGGGMLPKFSSDDVSGEDPDTSYLVEALYKLPLNDNISITPGAYAVFNPNHNTDNGTVYVGVVRTTFEF